MRFDGKLKTWNDERGFGFVEPVQGGQDIFVHIKSFPTGTGRPAVGLPLSFEVETGPDGKKRAKAVEGVKSFV
jgi:cold shock CspA family protein